MRKIMLTLSAAVLMCGCTAKRSVAVSEMMVESVSRQQSVSHDTLAIELTQVSEFDFDSLEMCVVTDSVRRTVWLRARRSSARRSATHRLQGASIAQTEVRDTIAVVSNSRHESTSRPTPAATATPWLLLAVATALGIGLYVFRPKWL